MTYVQITKTQILSNFMYWNLFYWYTCVFIDGSTVSITKNARNNLDVDQLKSKYT